MEGLETDVRVIDSRPPPAPARAWAILSPCWAAEVAGGATWVWEVVLDDWDIVGCLKMDGRYRL